MNRITNLASLAAIALFGQVSQAQSALHGTSTRVGNTTFQSWSNGTISTTTHIGGTSFHNLSTGITGTTHRIGTADFHSFSNGVSGTTQRIGATSFTSLGGKASLVSTQIGTTTFHSSSAGLGTTTRIRNSTFTTLLYRPVSSGAYVPRRLSGR